jgi:DNA-binding transcriptional regulator LsrR (DeoR family)
MKKINSYDQELMVKVSWLYYFEEFTQKEIAEKLSLSRSKVGRLIRRAVEDGIVEIKIAAESQSFHPEIENKFEKRFDLREAIITDSGEDYPQLQDNLGRAAAWYLDRVLDEDYFLGIGMGTTISAILPHLKPRNPEKGTIITLSGGFSQAGYDTSKLNISWPMADRLNARLEQMMSPTVAETEEARNAIISESNFQAQLERARSCDIALVSIGQVSHDMNLCTVGYCDEDDVTALMDDSAVGEVLVSFYDLRGQMIDAELTRRSIGLEITDLRNVPTCVGISGGQKKVQAILGALRADFLDVMITDQETAEAVLQLDELTNQN